MIRIYMVESKSYFVNADGIEYQQADGGCLPRVYTNKERAITDGKESASLYCNKFGYDLVMQSPDYPAIGTDCIYAARLIKDNGKYRQEFRVYEQFTW